MAVSIVIFKH